MRWTSLAIAGERGVLEREKEPHSMAVLVGLVCAPKCYHEYFTERWSMNCTEKDER